MKYRRIISAVSAFALALTLASCGTEDEPKKAAGETASTEEAEEVPAVNETPDDEDKPAETTKKAEEKKDKDEKSDKAETTTAAETTAKAADARTTTAAKQSGSTGGGNTGNAQENTAGENSGGSAGETPSGNGSGDNTAGGNDAPAENTDTPAETPEEVTYDAEISFGASPSVSGSNVTVDGSRVSITAGGTYHITGSGSEGQIYVSTKEEEKVKIVLDGVQLSCSTGPALFINEAKKCIVELADGSSNSLSDSTKDKVYDGVIFSNDTLRIKGSGSLEVNAGNRHGIASDDDIIIEGGSYVINSVKSGIYAHDNVTISGGNVTVYGGTNGIKSKGTVDLSGGNVYVSGGTKEEKHSIYAAVLNYTGGNVFAAGNKVTEPKTTASPYVGFSFPNGGAAGSELTFIVNGVEKGTLTPKNNFMSAVMFSTDISVGDTVSISVNGNSAGEFKIEDTKNVFAIE
ncbi:MAG: carbohydrate-binding domain-containing protein [Ruminococcus sp.]|nr:carbohydrate-binding domain-containing protein [Ruminococcus sp.]